MRSRSTSGRSAETWGPLMPCAPNDSTGGPAFLICPGCKHKQCAPFSRETRLCPTSAPLRTGGRPLKGDRCRCHKGASTPYSAQFLWVWASRASGMSDPIPSQSSEWNRKRAAPHRRRSPTCSEFGVPRRMNEKVRKHRIAYAEFAAKQITARRDTFVQSLMHPQSPRRMRHRGRTASCRKRPGTVHRPEQRDAARYFLPGNADSPSTR